MKGLYIHIPFCVKKCEYCDFVSFAGCDEHFEKYIDTLLCEAQKYKGTAVDTVFIGGGTPSVLPSRLISKLCNGIKGIFNISCDAEWTIEINPETLTNDKIKAMLDGGINRASVGVQSFNDIELKAAGRIHTSEKAIRAVSSLYENGFNNISLDLMELLPYQTEESFKRSLDIAVSLPISHISVYSLIIEEGTPIKEKYDRGVYPMPDENTDRRLYAYTKEFLDKRGFQRYEISNYAKDGFQSKHNLKYWDCNEYIGIGVAAHSYINGVRSYNTSDLSEYLNGVTCVGADELTASDKMGEFMMLGLRKTEGVNKQEFYKRFGTLPEKLWEKQIDKFEAMTLLVNSDNYIALTERGIDVSNAIMCEFL